jgi:phosphate starvation-inducible protein PhoH and related proteins
LNVAALSPEAVLNGTHSGNKIKVLPAKVPKGDPVFLQFDDNTHLALLFGEHDRHLARIEQLLGVSITSRGNCLSISGPTAAAVTAKEALLSLHKRARKGKPIDMGEVDAAVRMVDPAAEAGDGDPVGDDLTVRTRRRMVEARSPTQKTYITALRDHELVFGIGPAGTGKTYLAVAVAVSMLLAGRVNRIILSRPAVEAGERLGFLPGDMNAKIDPYLRPLYDALYDMLPADQVVKRLGTGEIEVAPLAFMRGRTLANAFIILDEAQNTTPTQMKMFLTRMGENSRMAVTGDLSQVDLPLGARSGLRDAIETLDGVEGASFVRFNEMDVVRHPMVTRIVRAYNAHDARLHDLKQTEARAYEARQKAEAPQS